MRKHKLRKFPGCNNGLAGIFAVLLCIFAALHTFDKREAHLSAKADSLLPLFTHETAEQAAFKLGDVSPLWVPSWLLGEQRRFNINTVSIITIQIIILGIILLFASGRGISQILKDNAALRRDAAALLSGDLMDFEKRNRIVHIKRRNIGLRVKLASFTIALVFAVVLMIATPLYVMMTRTQQQTLLQGLWDRSLVLLEGIAIGAQVHLPVQSVFELSLLPNQTFAVPEVRYVTITGHIGDADFFEDVVWATNDPDIFAKIDTAEFQPGISRKTDILTPYLQEIASEFNYLARSEIGALSNSIAAIHQEIDVLLLLTDEYSIGRLEEFQAMEHTLKARLSGYLNALARNVGSLPHFSVENFTVPHDHNFLLFKPILYRLGDDNVYFRGLVRLEVSVTSILEEIEAGRNASLLVIIIVALFAQITGAVGAMVLSMLLIRPIRQLVRHIEIIRDTENKAKLSDVEIHLKTTGELAILGDTINEMTRGLAKAAVAAADLLLGKEIQKKFIPLELDSEGNKLSYGSKTTEHLDFFGYYEGAKGVSGDYFDYIDLDGRYYAIIKCDVAGKGIPAALIVIQVATIFRGFFRRWRPTEKGMHIEDLVYFINDFIETLGYEGRFAAFTLCLYDSHTGIARFCNAGDNVVNFFDASEGKVRTLTLPEAPATGVLPNKLVESKGGYNVQTVTLDHGDILLLYTDGIEEAKRKFRDSEYEEIICENGIIDTPHENHIVGQACEELGTERVKDIINSVMNKKLYTLHKWHNPEGDEKELTFDFSSCDGSVANVIKAVVSVEKIFRCYKSPLFSEEDQVLVDKTVDAFLKEYFLQYRHYCSYIRDVTGNSAYIHYTHIRDDEQYDDLTLLGIKRK
jgi:serine phosphatase RsbU (regulator of sigma subunit)